MAGDQLEAVVCICGAKASVCPDNSYGSCVVSCSADCEKGPLYCLGVADLKVAIIQWNDRIPELRELNQLREENADLRSRLDVIRHFNQKTIESPKEEQNGNDQDRSSR